MPQYVDGFVIPIKKEKIEDYRKIAEAASRVWKDHGAIQYYECVGDDLDVKDQLPFTKLADAKPDETVVFAWIVYESREHRDAVNAKVMADPRITEAMKDMEMPFDCSKMAYGGFKTLVIA